MNLRLKILLLIVVTACTSLGVFAYISTISYIKDKTSYTYEQQILIAETISNQIREILGHQVKSVVDFVNIYEEAPSNLRTEILKFAPTFLNELYLVKSEEIEPIFLAKSKLKLKTSTLKYLDISKLNEDVTLRFLPGMKSSYQLIVRNAEQKVALVANVNSQTLSNLFTDSTVFTQLLIQDHKVIFRSGNTPIAEEDFLNLIEKYTNSNAKKISYQIKANSETYLVSNVNVGTSQLNLITLVPGSHAFAGLRLMLKRAILYFVGILAAAIAISIFSSAKITKALQKLTLGTKQISEGNFDLNLEINSKDEIKQLATGFNLMAKEVKLLIEKTATTARLQAEVETATTVQETLFPEPSGHLSNCDIVVYNKMASECGGDLCHYYENEKFTYFIIGDALGHGVGAALVTSAARSVLSVFGKFNILEPQEMMELLNLAIYDTCKGRMWMSVFIGRIEKSNSILTYTTAGHPSPILFRVQNEIHNPIMLSQPLGQMLGAEPEQTYVQTDISLKPNDLMLMFTDGLTELKNTKGRQWGDLRLVKSVLKHSLDSDDLNCLQQKIEKDYNKFRGDVELEDDVTFMLAKLKTTQELAP